jgi:two-component system nitrate/nitrite response regulator NarL
LFGKTGNNPSMILLASPSHSLCRRWRNALAGRFPLHQVADRQALVFSLREYQPTILFLDHSKHQFGPTRLVSKIIKSAPATKVIVLTGDPGPNEAVELIRAGAKGYCASSIGTTLLCRAARVVAAGEIWIGRKLLTALFDEFVRVANTHTGIDETPSNRLGGTNVFTGLSPREREITSLVASGQQNKFISNKLQISEKTVKAHLTTIFRKLGVDGRTQLALAVFGTHR